MKRWTPNSGYGGHAFDFRGFAQFLDGREKILPWIAEYSPYALVSADDSPVFLICTKPPTIGCELVYPGAPKIKYKTPAEYLIHRLKWLDL